jgi:hypothetical protein
MLFAAMSDKDVEAVVGALATSKALRGARVVCTRPDVPRAMEPVTLAATWARLAPATRPEVVADPGAALERALATGSGPVVVAGSLYLVGAVRARLVHDPLLIDPIDPPAPPGDPAEPEPDAAMPADPAVDPAADPADLAEPSP